MNKKNILRCAIITLTLSILLASSVHAKFAPIYEQAIITIAKIEEGQAILDENGESYQLSKPELNRHAKALKNKAARILYVVMGDKKIITDLKPPTTPPFIIPRRANATKSTVLQ